MRALTILAMTADRKWLTALSTNHHLPGGSRLIASRSAEEAGELLGCTKTRLILVRWQAETSSLEELDQLLWANSIQPKPATVVIVDEHYQPDLAITLYQMGVDDYLSEEDHASLLADIIEQAVVGTSSATSHRVETSEPAPVLVKQYHETLDAEWQLTAATA